MFHCLVCLMHAFNVHCTQIYAKWTGLRSEYNFKSSVFLNLLKTFAQACHPLFSACGPKTFLMDCLSISRNPPVVISSTRSNDIRRRSNYIIGFIAPAIGPNKSKKLTRLIATAHNIRGKVWMKNNIPMYVVFHSNFAAYIV